MWDGSAGRGTQTAHRLDTGQVGRGWGLEGLGGERESGEVAWEDQARMDACMNLRASRGRQSEIK